MSKKLATLIVKGRWILLAVFAGIMAFSVWGMSRVSVNYNLATYLPDESSTTIALGIMEKEFGLSGQVEVMVRDVTVDEAISLKNRIAGIEHIERVTFMNTDIYFNDANGDGVGEALLKIIIDGDDYSANADAVIESLGEELSNYEIVLNGQSYKNYQMKERLSNEMIIMVGLAVLIVAIVLLLTSQSWMEPVIFGAIIGISILINMGTNYFLGEISYVVKSIAAIMQMALSMDYALVTMHNYNEERAKGLAPKEAMIEGLAKSLSPVSASGLTTMAGLAAIMFMTYRIGLDIGLVLVKAIFISMMTVFLVMPGLIIILNKPIEKMRHAPIRLFDKKKGGSSKPKKKASEGMSKFLYKFRKVIPAVMVVIIAVCYVLQSNLSFEFAEGNKDRKVNDVVNVFGESNQVYMITPIATDENGGYDKQRQMIELLSRYYNENGEPILKDTLSYVTSVTLEVDAASASKLMGIDIALMNQLFGTYFLEIGAVKKDTVSLKDFLDFTVELVNGDRKISDDVDVAELVGEDIANYIKVFHLLLNTIDTGMSAKELTQFIASLSSYGIDLDLSTETAAADMSVNEQTKKIVKGQAKYSFDGGKIFDSAKAKVGDIDTVKKTFTLKGTKYSYDEAGVYQLTSVLADYIAQVYGMIYYTENPSEAQKLTLKEFVEYLNGLATGTITSGIDISVALTDTLKDQLAALNSLLGNINREMNADALFDIVLEVANIAGFSDIDESYRDYAYFIYGNYFMQDPLYKSYKINLHDLVIYIDSLANPVDGDGGLFGIDEMLGDSEKAALSALAGLFASMETENTADELYAILNDLVAILPDFSLEGIYLQQVYGNYYYDTEKVLTHGMTVAEFIMYAYEKTSDPAWSGLLDEALASQIAGLKYLMLEAMKEPFTAAEFFAMLNSEDVASLTSSMALSQTHINIVYTFFAEHYNDYTAYAFISDIVGTDSLNGEISINGVDYHYFENDVYLAANGTQVATGLVSLPSGDYFYDTTALYAILGEIDLLASTFEINGTTYVIDADGVTVTSDDFTVGSIDQAAKIITIGETEYKYSENHAGTSYVYSTSAIKLPTETGLITLGGQSYLFKAGALFASDGYRMKYASNIVLDAEPNTIYAYDGQGNVFKLDYQTQSAYTVNGGKVYDVDENEVTVDYHDTAARTFAVGGQVYYYRSNHLTGDSTGEGEFVGWDIRETAEGLYISTADFLSFVAEVAPDLFGLNSSYWSLLAAMGDANTFYDYGGMTDYINSIASTFNITINSETVLILYKLYYHTKNPAENYDPIKGEKYSIQQHNLNDIEIIGGEVLQFAAKLLNADASLSDYYDASIYDSNIASFVDAATVTQLINAHKVLVVAAEDATSHQYADMSAMLNGWIADFGMAGSINAELIRQVYIMNTIETGKNGISDGSYALKGEDLINYLIDLLADKTHSLNGLIVEMLTEGSVSLADISALLEIVVDNDSVQNYQELAAFAAKYMSIIGGADSEEFTELLKQAYILYNIDNAEGGVPAFAKSMVSAVELVDFIKALTTENSGKYSSLITGVLEESLIDIYDVLGLFNRITVLADTDLSSADLEKELAALLSAVSDGGPVGIEELNFVYAMYAVQNNLKNFTGESNAVSFSLGRILDFAQSLIVGNSAAYGTFISDILAEALVDFDETWTNEQFEQKKAAALEDIGYALQIVKDICADYKGGSLYTYEQLSDIINDAIAAILSDTLTSVLGEDMAVDGLSIDANMIEQVYVKYFVDYGRLPEGSIQVKTIIDFLNGMLETNTVVGDLMSEDQQVVLTNYSGQLAAGAKMFNGEDFSRIIFVLNLVDGSQEAFDFVDTIRSVAATVYGDETTYLAGNTPGLRDTSTQFDIDVTMTTLISAIAIFLVVMLIYRSLLLPLILVLVIQSAIWISFSMNVMMGSDMFFIANIIVTCIQMGATVDYGIILSGNYTNARKTMSKKKALTYALKHSMAPILTSGLVITIAGFTIGAVSTSIAVSTIGNLLGRGTMISVAMVLFLLPTLLLVLDKAIEKTTYKAKFFHEDDGEDHKFDGELTHDGEGGEIWSENIATILGEKGETALDTLPKPPLLSTAAAGAAEVPISMPIVTGAADAATSSADNASPAPKSTPAAATAPRVGTVSAVLPNVDADKKPASKKSVGKKAVAKTYDADEIPFSILDSADANSEKESEISADSASEISADTDSTSADMQSPISRRPRQNRGRQSLSTRFKRR